MSTKTKKILIILGSTLTLTFVAILVYYLFFKGTPTITTPPGSEIYEGSGLGEQGIKRLLPITQESVLGASINEENGKILYFSLNGEINSINFDGTEKTKIGVMTTDGIGDVSVSKNGKNILAKITSQPGVSKYIVYNIKKNSLKSLPERTVAASFDPSGENIAIALDKTLSKISTINIESGETTEITIARIPDIVIDWHGTDVVAIKTKPSGLAFGLLYNLDLKTKEISRILGNINGLTSLFSPSSKRALISQTSSDTGKELSLSVINMEKNTKQSIGLFTLPEKCAWFNDDRTIICASINAENEGKYVMPDDYYKGKIKFSSEDIVRINLDTGQKQNMINGVFDAQNLFLSKDEAYLYFINRVDGRLYRLTL